MSSPQALPAGDATATCHAAGPARWLRWVTGTARIRRRLAAGTLAVVLTGCATAPPPIRPAPGHAEPPRADGLLADAEAELARRHGDGVSGLRLLPTNGDALRWRLAVIDSARHTLDLQYYVWFGDKVGQLLMARVLAAADRGVRVRLLVDDLSTMLHDMTHVELRDGVLARLDRHPRIELRVFNPWHERGLAGRAFEMASDFTRLNRRMHNKQMVVDNRVAVIGGRNIGDEYFGLNPEFNFHDLDVLAVGPVARQASAVFDRYWNSDWVGALPRRVPDPAAELPSAADRAALEALEGDARSHVVLAGLRDWSAELAALPASLMPGRAQVHADPPSRAEGVSNHMPQALRELMLSARREVLVTNAYVIPDERFMADLATLRARGVRVRLLTNSLASHDVPAVNSHYENWRAALVDAGVGLHEWRPDPAVQAVVVDTPPVRGRFAGLHTKAVVVDRTRSYIGSMNLDPRSKVFNSEMGVLIDSPALAESLAAAMERDMGPANSWHVTRGPDGVLTWTDDRGARTRQPARDVWQRLQNLVFKLFPPNLY